MLPGDEVHHRRLSQRETQRRQGQGAVQEPKIIYFMHKDKLYILNLKAGTGRGR